MDRPSIPSSSSHPYASSSSSNYSQSTTTRTPSTSTSTRSPTLSSHSHSTTGDRVTRRIIVDPVTGLEREETRIERRDRKELERSQRNTTTPSTTQPTTSTTGGGGGSGSTTSSKSVLTIALQRAQSAVLLDSANNLPAAISAYSQSVRLLKEVMARVQQQSSSSGGHGRNLSTGSGSMLSGMGMERGNSQQSIQSIGGLRKGAEESLEDFEKRKMRWERKEKAKIDEARRLKVIHDTYEDRIKMLLAMNPSLATNASPSLVAQVLPSTTPTTSTSTTQFIAPSSNVSTFAGSQARGGGGGGGGGDVPTSNSTSSSTSLNSPTMRFHRRKSSTELNGRYKNEETLGGGGGGVVPRIEKLPIHSNDVGKEGGIEGDAGTFIALAALDRGTSLEEDKGEEGEGSRRSSLQRQERLGLQYLSPDHLTSDSRNLSTTTDRPLSVASDSTFKLNPSTTSSTSHTPSTTTTTTTPPSIQIPHSLSLPPPPPPNHPPPPIPLPLPIPTSTTTPTISPSSSLTRMTTRRDEEEGGGEEVKTPETGLEYRRDWPRSTTTEGGGGNDSVEGEGGEEGVQSFIRSSSTPTPTTISPSNSYSDNLSLPFTSSSNHRTLQQQSTIQNPPYYSRTNSTTNVFPTTSNTTAVPMRRGSSASAVYTTSTSNFPPHSSTTSSSSNSSIRNGISRSSAGGGGGSMTNNREENMMMRRTMSSEGPTTFPLSSSNPSTTTIGSSSSSVMRPNRSASLASQGMDRTVGSNGSYSSSQSGGGNGGGSLLVSGSTAGGTISQRRLGGGGGNTLEAHQGGGGGGSGGPEATIIVRAPSSESYRTTTTTTGGGEGGGGVIGEFGTMGRTNTTGGGGFGSLPGRLRALSQPGTKRPKVGSSTFNNYNDPPVPPLLSNLPTTTTTTTNSLPSSSGTRHVPSLSTSSLNTNNNGTIRKQSVPTPTSLNAPPQFPSNLGRSNSSSSVGSNSTTGRYSDRSSLVPPPVPVLSHDSSHRNDLPLPSASSSFLPTGLPTPSAASSRETTLSIPPVRRPFHLMRLILATMSTNSSSTNGRTSVISIAPTSTGGSGGYLSEKLFVPSQVWTTQGTKLVALETKVRTMELLLSSLDQLERIGKPLLSTAMATTAASSGTGGERWARDEAFKFGKELEGFEQCVEGVQTTLSKKLGGIVSMPSGGGIGSSNNPSSSSNNGGGGGPFHSTFEHGGDSMMRGKDDNKSLLSSGTGGSIGGKESRKGSTAGFSSWSSKFQRGLDRVTNANVVSLDSQATYVDTIARLFKQAQCIDHHLSLLLSSSTASYDPSPTAFSSPDFSAYSLLSLAEKHRIERQLRRTSEFFGTVVCRFVMKDVGALLDKYVKRGGAWLSGE